MKFKVLILKGKEAIEHMPSGSWELFVGFLGENGRILWFIVTWLLSLKRVDFKTRNQTVHAWVLSKEFEYVICNA